MRIYSPLRLYIPLHRGDDPVTKLSPTFQLEMNPVVRTASHVVGMSLPPSDCSAKYAARHCRQFLNITPMYLSSAN